MTVVAREALATMWSALGGAPGATARVEFTGDAELPSAFSVTDLAAASIGAAGLAAAELAGADRGDRGASDDPVVVDRRLASAWFLLTINPIGWELPPQWDALAGDYEAADAWIRLHTNAPHHRAAALRVLGCDAERDAVARAVRTWNASELESAVVDAGGCAAEMRTSAAWDVHPQGAAVAAEPLVHWDRVDETADEMPAPAADAERPLAGVRVLDLTRLLAGPVATRLLAGLGADVLRIDPPDWDEPGIVTEVTLGKRCARLDAATDAGRARLAALLREADVFVHGYRPDALDRLGLDAETCRQLRPGLVDVSLDAYGWSGPWQGRRGFDSLVQMSSGIAATGMEAKAAMNATGGDRPFPLPAQALDHATGYLLAAAALRGLRNRRLDRQGSRARLSLARTARLLTSLEPRAFDGGAVTVDDGDYEPRVEHTAWGDLRRLRVPVTIPGVSLHWDRPATPLGSDDPQWR